MDKSGYVQGDTIWFKAYVVKGSYNQLSDISRVLYVELINKNDSITHSLRLPVMGGTSKGIFVLDRNVPAGSYRIRAYTQWMRNASEKYFYDQSFQISVPGRYNLQATLQHTKMPDTVSSGTQSSVQPAIQFYPEGGHLVNGITSRMGFKAVDANGLGRSLSGKILDQTEKVINSFKSLHAGIGSVHFTPERGNTYKAEITFADQTQQTVALPSGDDHGLVLGVFQPNSDSLLVRISTLKLGQELNLIANSGNETIFSSKININKPLNSIWLEKNAFPSGIAHLMLIDAKGDTVNERIVFIKNPDKMAISVQGVKQIYKSREQVSIILNARDGKGKPTAGTFSISVTDETRIPAGPGGQPDIFANLQLRSDLVNPVEDLTFYFSSNHQEANSALDNLMLTQKPRTFPNPSKYTTSGVFPPEGLGMKISGIVTNTINQAYQGAEVKLVSARGNLVSTAKTNALGKFSFDNVIPEDSLGFTLSAMGLRKKDQVAIVLDHGQQIDTSPQKKHSDQNILPKNNINIPSMMFPTVKRFYSPTYDGIDHNLADHRSTIYFNPDIRTYGNGQAEFSFFCADGPGKYKAVIEGINGKGEIGREVIRFEVISEKYQESFTDRAVKALKKFSTSHGQEKIYLHTDKSTYVIGDTVWFKAYLTDELMNNSTKSGRLYVELINAEDSVLTTLKLPVQSGSAEGQLSLTKLSEAGNYRIRAYTHWMRNFAPEFFFNRILPVGSIQTVAAEGKKSSSTRIQFFPEGGTLLQGVANKITFKVTDTAGSAVDLEGMLLDQQGNQLAKLKTQHMGLGQFLLTPDAGKTYQIQMGQNGIARNIQLPEVRGRGYMMSANLTPTKDSLEIGLRYVGAADSAAGQICFIAQTAKHLQFTQHIVFHNNQSNLRIPIKGIPAGVMQCILLSETMGQLTERLVFIAPQYNTVFEPHDLKKEYSPGEQVSFSLSSAAEATQAPGGSYSIAVAKKEGPASSEPGSASVESELLLNSEFSDYIEQPESYFSQTAEMNALHLDMLLTSLNYTKVSWQDLLAGKTATLNFRAEENKDMITGKLLTMNGEGIPAGTITMINTKKGIILSENTDDEGKFQFQGLTIHQGDKYSFQGRARDKKQLVQIKIDEWTAEPVHSAKKKSILPVNITIPERGALPEKPSASMEDKSAQGKLLKEVKITKNKKWGFGNSINENQADEVFRPNPKMPCRTLMECLSEANKTRLRFEYEGSLWLPMFGKAPYYVLIDGMLVEPEDYQTLLMDSITNIDKIYLAQESKAIQMRLLSSYTSQIDSQTPPPVMAIFTRNGQYRSSHDPSIVHIQPKGLDAMKEYSQKFQETDKNETTNTIFWNPRAIPDAGRIKVSFPAPQHPGNYVISMQGIATREPLKKQDFQFTVR